MIPAAVQLARSFDPDRLAADLTLVSGHRWRRQQVHDRGRPAERTSLDWRVLPLRSIGGDGDRTDPGGPGLADFAATRWLDCTPYLAEVLAAIPGPVNAARLMALGPGTASHTHSDPKYALARGFARLHVPITTNAGAVLVLDGQEHRWQPGQLWCGQFARPHAVRNDGATARVHLVVDVLLSTGLAELFPAHLRAGLRARALFTRPATGGAARVEAAVQVPEAFTDFSRDDVLADPGQAVRAELVAAGACGHLRAGGGEFALVHLGGGEFRFAGWSEQRTLHVQVGAVLLRTRDGSRATGDLTVPFR
ncbi:aspartyl/asparaginyl beta-hydroxylase domain-containing protein [Actinomadura viridis]|uniref:aspartyl/asparaginyl beta-hydroxylase domain-containing protein n=1 Tax=Actinomadura viridis TaxID=58110 RepID=UPI0036AAD2F7